MTLEEFKEKNDGKRGTKEREELEAGCETVKIGALIHDVSFHKLWSIQIRVNNPLLAYTTHSFLNNASNVDCWTSISDARKSVTYLAR